MCSDFSPLRPPLNHWVNPMGVTSGESPCRAVCSAEDDPQIPSMCVAGRAGRIPSPVVYGMSAVHREALSSASITLVAVSRVDAGANCRFSAVAVRVSGCSTTAATDSSTSADWTYWSSSARAGYRSSSVARVCVSGCSTSEAVCPSTGVDGPNPAADSRAETRSAALPAVVCAAPATEDAVAAVDCAACAVARTASSAVMSAFVFSASIAAAACAPICRWIAS